MIAVSLVALTTLQAAATKELVAEYRLTVRDVSERAVDVELILTGLSGPLELGLPERISYAQLDDPRLTGDVGVSPDTVQIERSAPFRWRLDPGSEPAATLTWRVALDHREQPAIRAGHSAYEFPYLRDDHGMLVLGALAIAPLDAEPRLTVRFELPEGWPVHIPWPSDVSGAFEPASVAVLHDELAAVGAWDVVEHQAGGMDLTVAFAPGQEELARVVGERVGPIVEAEVALFGGAVQPRYLVLFGEPLSGGYGGSPKTASMTMFASADLPPELAAGGVEHLIAHEFHHTWMRARCELPDELRFVAEGFTDYYAYLVPWRLGLTDDADLLRKLGEKLAEYERVHEGADRSLTACGGPAFFEGGTAYAATYAGGLCLALLTDLAIRANDAAPGDLDALLRDFYNDPRWAEERPALADLLALVERYAGSEHRARVEALATQPGVGRLGDAFAELGVELARSERPDRSLRANFEGARVLNLAPDGGAWRLGLREGDTLLEVNGRAVEDEGGIRRAWREADGARMRLRFTRPGEEEPREVDMELTTVEYRLSEEVLARPRREF